MWTACKPMKVNRAGAPGGSVQVVPGDPVPEAEGWPNRQNWVDTGFVRYVNRPEPEVVKTTPLEPDPVKVAEAKAVEKAADADRAKANAAKFLRGAKEAKAEVEVEKAKAKAGAEKQAEINEKAAKAEAEFKAERAKAKKKDKK